MKPLKSILCCLAAALIFSAPLHSFKGGYARALSARYARADVEDVYFCEEEDLNTALFAIPCTYCVEIIFTDGDWYHVKYAANAEPYEELYGYCLKENLTPVEEPPENIYLHMPVKVTYRPDASVGSLPTLGNQDVIAAFYGSYKSGATYYSYVGYKGQFGYIDVVNEDYPRNEIPIPDPPSGSTKKGGLSSKGILIIVFGVLIVAVPAVLYFTGRKRYFKP